MDKEFNPARYGLTLQRLICARYNLDENLTALRQFNANYDENFAEELVPVVDQIVNLVGSKPSKLLTYTSELNDGKQTTSPHNFILANGKTLSLRTTQGTGMVAPRTIGQAGYNVLNEYFSEIFGEEVEEQWQVRKNMYEHIHEVLPLFIECFFPSDYNVIVERAKHADKIAKLSVYKLSDIADYSFKRSEFIFTRDLAEWTESTTLKYHGISIAELQTHKNRTFKFRFKISAIPTWFKLVKETTETFGITAEAAICDVFGLEKPDSFKTRVSRAMHQSLVPVIKDAFKILPVPIKHTGSEVGERGEASKCSYDFLLKGEQKLSLKTNTGNRVCPPEVGLPGATTCLLYFKEFLPEGTVEIDNEIFKQMVFDNIEKLMPLYLSHLFDSDWLLWIYKSGEKYLYEVIHQTEINTGFVWQRDKFAFTKTR